MLLQTGFVNEKYEKPKSRFPGKSISSAEVLGKFIMQKAIPLAGHKSLENSKMSVNLRNRSFAYFVV
jgi:hypothetical protein